MWEKKSNDDGRPGVKRKRKTEMDMDGQHQGWLESEGIVWRGCTRPAFEGETGQATISTSYIWAILCHIAAVYVYFCHVR